jgi:tetratricopeptide (TPR) repeat protein
LWRLGASHDYGREILEKLDVGKSTVPIEDAASILDALWADLKRTLTRPDLCNTAWVLRCFLEIDATAAPHRSVRVRACKSYAVKNDVSEEQARLDFLAGVERVHRAARRVLSKWRDMAVADLHEGLLVIKRHPEINSQFAIDDDIGFMDQYVSQLSTLVPNMKGEVMYETMYNAAAQNLRTQLGQKKLAKGSLWYRSQLGKIAEQYQKVVFLFEAGKDINSIREHLLKAGGYRVIEGENQELLANRIFLKAIEAIRIGFELQYPQRRQSSGKRSAKEGPELRKLDAIVAEAMQSSQLDAKSKSSIELYQQAVHKGRYDDAKKLYQTRLERPLRYRLGAYRLCIGLVRVFFPDGGDCPSRLTKPHDRAWALNTLANLRAHVGGPWVIPVYQASIKISDALGDKVCLARGLYNLGNFQLGLGQIERAQQNVRRGLDLSYEVGHYYNIGLGHQELGLLYSYKGKFDNSLVELREALSFFREIDELQAECVVWQYHCLRKLLAGNPEFVLIAARAAHTLANQVGDRYVPVKHDLLRIHWLLGRAQVAKASQEGRQKDHKDKYMAEAKGHLTESLAGCRRSNLVELEPDVLLARARWHRANGDTERARESVEQARVIAERCGYRLKQAEIHNFLARMALDEGNKPVAKQQAEIAEKYALCDGPGYCYKPALEEARRLMG